eukprot:gene4897-5370_t
MFSNRVSFTVRYFTTNVRAVTLSGRVARMVAGSSAPYSSDASRRVYVGNLEWSVSGQDLKDHIGGHVLSADILQFPDGRSKGCGIVEFDSVQEAAAAIAKLQDSELKGRKMFLREDRVAASKRVSLGDNASSPTASSSKTVVIDNLPDGISWQDLKDLMKKIGAVKHVNVFQQAGAEGQLGVAKFAHDNDAIAAVNNLNGHLVGGRAIRLRLDDHGSLVSMIKQTIVPKRLYVGQLPFSVTGRDLKDHFKTIGPVLRADVALDASGRSKGYGFVEYENAEDATRAVAELNETIFDGRHIYVRKDRELI